MTKRIVSLCIVLVLFLTIGLIPKQSSEFITANQAEEDQWTPLVTGLEGGFITAIVADQDIDDHFYAGTAEHGVFETINAGKDWTSISKSLENKMVTALFLYKGTLYVGTHQDLFRTSSHGQTWEKAEAKFPKVNCILICADIIYVGTNQGLYKSMDKHNSFKIFEVNDPELKGTPILSIAANGLNPSTVYAGSLDKGILATINGGINWFKINNSLPQQPVVKIVIDPITGSKIYATLREQGIWMYSFSASGIKNNTLEWLKLIDLPDIQVQNAIITKKGSEIVLGTYKEGAYIFKIESKQLTKLPVPDGYFSFPSLDMGNNKLILGTAGKGCIRSADRGVTWEVDNRGINAIKVINLIIDPMNHNKWIASSFACLFISQDRGATWNKVIKGLPESLITCLASNPLDSQFLMVGTEESGLYESFDGGSSWSKNKTLNYSRITCIAMDSNHIYVGTLAKGIFYSSDQGKTWTSLDLGTKKDQKGSSTDYITALTMDPTNPNIVYVGTNINGIFKSIDQGKNWSHIYEVLGQDIYINDIQVDKNDNKIIYAGIKIINDGGFIRSLDQGKTWESTNQFRGGMVFKTLSIDQHENSIVFSGTTEGVYYTKDGGYHWYNYDNGLDKVYKMYLNQFPINRIIQDPDQDNKIIIATHWGIYECLKSRKTLDKVLPQIKIEKPLSLESYTNLDQLGIKGRATDEFGIESIKVNDAPVEFNKSSGSFQLERNLRLGDNEFVIQVQDVSRNENEVKINVFLDQTLPELDIVSPLNFTKVTENKVWIKGHALDNQSGIATFQMNQKEIHPEIKKEDGYFEYNFEGLMPGKNKLIFLLTDNAGNQIQKDLEIIFEIVDTNPPIIELLNPDKEITYTSKEKMKIEGNVTDSESGIFRVKINNSNINWDQTGHFVYMVDLKEGDNDFEISALDLKENEASKKFKVVLDSIAPKIIPTNLSIDQDANTSNKNFVVKFGVVEMGLGIASLQFYLNETLQVEKKEPKVANFEIPLLLAKGISTIRILAVDKIGNSSEFTGRINYDPPVLIKLQIGNNKVEITRDEIKSEKTIDVAPMIYQKRTMVPLRFLSEAFDATVIWLPKPIEEAKISYLNKFTIYLKPWNPIARIEYPPEIGKPTEKITLDAPPIISNNRTLVPLRFISDMFGAKVNWDGKTQTIEILLAKY